MTDIVEGVNATSPIANQVDDFSDLPDDLSSFSVKNVSGSDTAQGGAGVTEKSPTSSPEEAPSDDGEEQVASGQETKEPADEAAKQPKDAVRRRISQLTARAKEAEEKLLGKDKELVVFRKANQLLQDQLKELNARLAQYEELDPVEQENRYLKVKQAQARLTQEVARERQRIEAEYRKRLEQMVAEERQADEAERLMLEAQRVLSEYPGVTQEQLAVAIAKNPDVDMAELARRIDEENYRRYASRLSKANAPKPLRTQGTVATEPKIETDEDLIRYVDSVLGENW